MEFRDIVDYATDIANITFADVNTKYKTRDTIIKSIVIACLHYEKDKKFKEQVDSYIRLNLR